MTTHKRPELKLAGNISENFKNFALRFNDYCIQSDYRNLDKDPQTEQEEHYKKPLLEIAALRSSLPDEALQVIRYTIEPSIPEPDKKKPWVWMESLRTHYTGTSGSTLMTDRFKFWHSSQNQNETVQEWEVKIRQAGSLCEYGNITDIMCRDKFVFGLSNDTMRTELLKTHLRPDGTQKAMADVVAEAKSMESARVTNKLINDTTKGIIEETVHWTKSNQQQTTRKKHRDMKLKREPNTCHWCGDTKGPHPWTNCPANGRKCSKCGGYDHFARVCLEQQIINSRGRGYHRPTQTRDNNQRFSSFNRTNTQQESGTTNPVHAMSTYNHQEVLTETPPEQGGQPAYYTDEHPLYYSTLYTVENQNNMNQTTRKKYFTTLLCSSTETNFVKLTFQIDSAATSNTISLDTVQKYFPDIQLQKSRCILKPYGNRSEPIIPVGQINLLCEKFKKYYSILFQVLHPKDMDRKPALLSGEDCETMNIISIRTTDEAHSLTEDSSSPAITSPLTKELIVEQYKQNFTGVGCLNPPVSFQVKSDVTPVQMPIHRVPLSKRLKEKAAIERYVKEGILEKVTQPTSWCSNILCREQPNKFRVCIDPSQTINQAIERPVYQMPTLNEHLHKLNNAKCFTVIDVKDGYFHVPLDNESSTMTTMHTTYGRYRWKRLPFGINSAPEEFQMRLMTALEGLEGIATIADDILVYGCGDTYEAAEKDHDKNIIALMERAIIKNIRFNPAKLKFKQKELKFVGHILTQEGIKADPEKTSAILKMQKPHDKQSLQRFIGMVNYLSPYCQNLSTVIRPLTELTKTDVAFIWSSIQQTAFDGAKRLIASTPVLQYFDQKKQVILQVDASEKGLGGTLLQKNNQDQLLPVAFTSCTLTDTERRYSQIEKECLAICNAFSKFDHWLYGHKNIEVHSDHKPLEIIMKKPLNRAPARLQRMLSRLQRYQFSLVYKKGTSLYIADTLSRAPLEKQSTNNINAFEVFRMETESEYPQHHMQLKNDTEMSILAATKNDPIFQRLYNLIQKGWPDTSNQLDPDLKPYWNFRDELSINNGFIYKGHCTMIRETLKELMLQKIHANHMGAASNTRMAKEILFWPNMTKDITNMCQNCSDCAKYQTSTPKEPMRSLPVPSLPWQIVSQDLFEYESRDYLVTVCHFSDWIEVDLLPDTLSTTVVNHTKAHFSRYGVPEICHTDNGPQFISNEFKTFAEQYGFHHTRSAPYHPKGNGRAEAAVKVAKNMLKKSKDIQTALLNYRNTPQQGHLYSPAQRMMNRRTKTLLPTSKAALVPSPVDIANTQQQIIDKRKAAKEIYDRQAGPVHNKLELGTYAYAKPPPQKRGQQWTYGQVIEKDETSYTMKTPNNRTIRRNRVHIRPAAAPSQPLIIHTPVLVRPPHTTTVPHHTTIQNDPIPSIPSVGHSPREQNQNTDRMFTTLVRPKRNIKPPLRFQDYDMS